MEPVPLLRGYLFFMKRWGLETVAVSKTPFFALILPCPLKRGTGDLLHRTLASHLFIDTDESDSVTCELFSESDIASASSDSTDFF